MKKVLTIDFDIMMRESIDIYNDSDQSATEFLAQFTFLDQLPFDFDLYYDLTKLLLNFEKKQIVFMEYHNEFVDLTRNEGPFELINIDYHHDLGYGDNIKWKLPVRQVDEGNWVKKLWDLGRINKYIWICDYDSNDVPFAAKKFLTEKHLVESYDLETLIDCDKIFISFSSDYIPDTYHCLYNLWKELFYIEIKDEWEKLEEEQEQSEQLSFDLIEEI